jgi:hypothetical protein
MDGTRARRRQQEFDGAASRYELDLVMNQWAEEDAAAQQARSIEVRRVDDLSHRLRRLEALVSALPDALGEALARHVAGAFEKQAPLRYAGVWAADEDYARNTLATYDGGMWLALGTPSKGRRPKVDPAWRLVVKTAPDGVVA